MSKITVKDIEGQTLKEFTLEQRDMAYDYIRDLEQWGVEATIYEPSLPETLIQSLGANKEDTEKLKDAIDQELKDHEA